MRRNKIIFETVCDWSVVKWSVLIGGERLSRDKMERSDWLIEKLGVWSKSVLKSVRGFVWGHTRSAVIGRIK